MRKNLKKYLCQCLSLFLLLIVGMMVQNTSALAAESGWKQTETGWQYYYEDGTLPAGQWFQDTDGKWYYFQDNAVMQTGWLQDKDNAWYYLKENGQMQTGWQMLSGTWYYLEENGQMQTGWQMLSDTWYYLHENGAMASDEWVDGYYMDVSGAWLPDRAVESDYQSRLKERIQVLRSKYPDGMYWNHMGLTEFNSETVTSVPCDHVQYARLQYCNYYILGRVKGYQCDGFARKMSDEVFGTDASLLDYTYSFDAVKVGDYLRFSETAGSYVSAGHSVFVIDKTEDSLITVEANYGSTCMIHWDGRLDREWLDSLYVQAFSRY